MFQTKIPPVPVNLIENTKSWSGKASFLWFLFVALRAFFRLKLIATLANL